MVWAVICLHSRIRLGRLARVEFPSGVSIFSAAAGGVKLPPQCPPHRLTLTVKHVEKGRTDRMLDTQVAELGLPQSVFCPWTPSFLDSFRDERRSEATSIRLAVEHVFFPPIAQHRMKPNLFFNVLSIHFQLTVLCSASGSSAAAGSQGRMRPGWKMGGPVLRNMGDTKKLHYCGLNNHKPSPKSPFL